MLAHGYTPVKGTDYFTEEEIQQIQNEVSGGAIGDFKAVVDEETATFNTNAENTLTDYNANAQEKFDTYNTNADSKFETYNTNAETKFSVYNTNAKVKLSEYNQNVLDKTTLYNTNADSKFTTYNENAETKFSEYTSNADTKLSEYNQNDSDKTALYNANAESKLGAYDSNAQAKLDLYNQNDSEKTEAYNSNAQTKLAAYNENSDERISELNTQTEQIQNELKILATETAKFDANAKKKLEDYDSNAEAKLIEYNSNDSQKTSAYNQNALDKLNAYNTNAESKLAEYNQNAETKTAEFDSNAAALQEQMAKKANVDGYYEEMTVGDAEQLVATQFVEDNEPYLFRPTGGSSDVGNRAYFDKIVGGTVVWNQLWNYEETGEEDGVNFTYENHFYDVVKNTTANNGIYVLYNVKENNKYYLSFEASSSDNIELTLSLGQWLNVKLTEKNERYSTVITSDAMFPTPRVAIYLYSSSGVTCSYRVGNIKVVDLTLLFGSGNEPTVEEFERMFPKDYYPYNAGELLSVEGLQSHGTVGFNQFDKNTMVVENVYIDNVDGVEKSNTGALATDFIPVIPNATYFINTEQTAGEWGAWYDADKNYISGITGYGNVDPTHKVKTAPSNAHYMRLTIKYNGNGNLDTLCINLSDPSRNGEYEPYEKHSYPLDSSLTLRGIPNLDASKNLYYDGDEYESDGTVTRKYGVYTIQASNVSLNNNAYTNISYAEIINLPNMLRSMYKQCVHSKFGVGKYGHPFDDASHVGELLVNSAVSKFWFGFAKGTTEEQMKSALDGTTIVYELATPTTETAKPFQHIQIVDDFGTEEFVSTGIVPVGHKTRYPANLRDKLQHLPSLASADGTYLIQQSGKQMSLVHMPAVFPETPTEDGTYTLKTVVTGGVATLKWVVE